MRCIASPLRLRATQQRGCVLVARAACLPPAAPTLSRTLHLRYTAALPACGARRYLFALVCSMLLPPHGVCRLYLQRRHHTAFIRRHLSHFGWYLDGGTRGGKYRQSISTDGHE